jgi:predicted DNA-binding transcriptional regulator YafY
VILWIQGTAEQIRTVFPASVATVTDAPPPSGEDQQAGQWLRVELRAERLDWVPPLLASLDQPFSIEQPADLRDLVVALAGRLSASARRVQVAPD